MSDVPMSSGPNLSKIGLGAVGNVEVQHDSSQTTNYHTTHDCSNTSHNHKEDNSRHNHIDQSVTKHTTVHQNGMSPVVFLGALCVFISGLVLSIVVLKRADSHQPASLNVAQMASTSDPKNAESSTVKSPDSHGQDQAEEAPKGDAAERPEVLPRTPVEETLPSDEFPYLGNWSNGRGQRLTITRHTLQFQNDPPVSYSDITRITDGYSFRFKVEASPNTNYWSSLAMFDFDLEDGGDAKLSRKASMTSAAEGGSQGYWFRK